ncbi:predicted protein [Naegleria gruberi]|uniref:Predicted protein n=1 Tax=Naegleria gruberi TaxID=5762 RepID=D2VLD7_NAEGR|nr:uncharacterized protein NAEGRDRAFT_69743 [Naegleria gruberi]EFC42371.1 predicted protein [Naegleria gruberi]|eukprot:XP_002675115.1 predicted protein [Naegleria gruberi strain NEG-M]
MSNHIREAQAWKERCVHEDKAALSFINSYVLAREMNNSKAPSNVPPGFKSQGLPHLLSPVDRKKNGGDFSQRSQQDEDEMFSTRSSVKSYKSNNSINSQRSNLSNRSNRSALDEESKKKIEMLEKSLDEERKGRLEVQQELQNLKQLIKENLKK